MSLPSDLDGLNKLRKTNFFKAEVKAKIPLEEEIERRKRLMRMRRARVMRKIYHSKHTMPVYVPRHVINDSKRHNGNVMR